MPVFFHQNVKKARPRQSAFFISFLCLAALACYGYLVEPSRIIVEHVVIADDELYRAWGKVSIAQLSDLHISTMGSRESKVLRLLSEIHPDLLVVTGDWVQWNRDPAAALRFLELLNAPLGVYGVLGDADLSTGRRCCAFCHPAGDVHRLRRQPKLLSGGYEVISLPTGKKMFIAGSSPEEPEEAAAALSDRLAAVPQGMPLLILDHYAAGWRRIKHNAPLLWLAGDTHGGQLALPGAIWKKLHLVDYPRYLAGLFTNGHHKWLYVNRGIGTVSYFPFRIGVPPEITVITFSRATSTRPDRGDGQ